MLLVVLILDVVLSLVLLLPWKDESASGKRFPVMTVSLVAINILIHIFFHYFLPNMVAEEALATVQMRFLLVPVDILDGVGLGAASMVTAAFLHADWGHLLGNMFYLFFFGRKVEGALGPGKFSLFYLTCILISSIVSVLGRVALPVTQGMLPGLGASGAVMGMVAGYLFLYGEQQIRTLVMLAIIPIPFVIKMPAWVFIFYTVVTDTLNAWLQQEFQTIGYIYSLVGSFAHLGGAVAGIVCMFFLLPPNTINRHK